MSGKILLLASLFLFAASAQAKNYGADMPKGDALDIATAAGNIANLNGKPGKFKGRITQVCQKQGCWLVIESGGTAARIKTNDVFFVPKDSSGEAVVYGEIKQVEMKPEMARHLAEDAGKPVLVANNEIQILATAITIK